MIKGRKPKQRLRRPCKYCGEMFHPTGRETWVCLDCYKKRLRGKWKK